MVEEALRIRATYGRSREDAVDAVWVMLDAERVHASDARQAVEKAAAAGLHVAISNPSFEVWLLCHQAPQAAPMTAADAKRRCGELGIPGHAGPAVFDDPRLGGAWTTAAQAASKRRSLIARQEGLEDFASALVVVHGNPSTNVDELIEALRSARPGRAA